MVSSQKCPFCNPIADEIVAQNDLCYARWDRFPVSRGHLLVIPFRHEPDFFSLFIEEKQAMVALIDVCKGIVGEQFQPAGYNIGVNVGEAAGQTIMHCHCHVIPRYAGDVRDPRGGVRWVVPKKRGNEITGDVSGHIRHGRDPVFF
ncbi:MAG: HIT family protein [Methanoregula sp.]|uniref:HIT family protein n=1 Tax=Methanoregula sp. TaxID=2052170 RepID=UPI003C6952AB